MNDHTGENLPPGDPLLSTRVRRQHDRRPARVPSPRSNIPPRTALSPGGRLAFSVIAVAVGSFALSQPHDDAVTAPAATTPTGPGSQPVPAVERKRVLVSDPANWAIVREIAGDLLVVETIIPPGANGHTYEPVPADAIKASTADLYIENGMGLNDSVTKFVMANYRSPNKEVRLSDVIPEQEVISTDSPEQIAAHGHAHAFNAHFWTDPNYAILYARTVALALSNLDPANQATYSARADAFITRLTALDAAFRAAIQSIPTANRKLVVYHDSWSYFGRRYGIPVVGAIQPVSFAEPSAEEIRRMIEQIKRERVPAFFGSEVFPTDVLDVVAQETGSRYYSDLSDEELPGAPGTPEHSYEGMMIANVRLITSALGGNVALLDQLKPGAGAS